MYEIWCLRQFGPAGIGNLIASQIEDLMLKQFVPTGI